MKNTGRFETSTKTKMQTEFGIVLKVTHYLLDATIEEYRIRPKCKFCGSNIDCLCFNEDNAAEPFKTAVDNLQTMWVCTKDECVIKDVQQNDPDYYKELQQEFGKNQFDIAEEIRSNWGELDEGDLCNT